MLFLLALQCSEGGSVWPKPRTETRGSLSVALDPSSFQISCPSTPSFLPDACERYNKLFFPFALSSSINTTASYTLKVEIDDTSSSPKLVLGVDESYALNVTASGANLKSKTVWGALHGLETMSQLIDVSFSSSSAVATYHVTKAPIVISDQPRYQWRGILIDTARHFLSPMALRDMIDALAYNKMNTLHWHLTDAQSFPIEIKAYPLLSSKGAYGYDAIYTHQDVADLVQYAYVRGVRLVPEIDVPGHAYSWGMGYPEIRAVCPQALSANINNFPLNPSTNQTFTVMDAIFQDLATIFNTEFLHTGGDEVVYSCWTQDPQVAAWMKKEGLTDGPAVFAYMEKRISTLARKSFKGAIVWQEPFEHSIPLPKDTVIHVWKSLDIIPSVVRAGYRVLASGGWYLDKQIPDPPSVHYLWEDTWMDLYNVNPSKNLSQAEADMVLGGEAAMWAEQVDETNIQVRVWPRASAVGERLWSSNIVSTTEAKPRLAEFRCKSMARRGIRAGPIMPDYCPLPL